MNTHIEKNAGNGVGRSVLSAFLILSALLIMILQILLSINFDRHVKGHLKLAADANTIELAEEELGIALTNIEDAGFTDGYTSILYPEPTEDISFWYRNLKASKDELAKVKNSSQLEKTNTLMKLRETLLDGGSEGKTKVTYPKGLHRYPNNLMWASLSWYALFAFFAGIYFMFSKEQWEKWNTAAATAEQKSK